MTAAEIRSGCYNQQIMVQQIEDVEDLAQVGANATRRVQLGEKAFMRECVTGAEALRHLGGETLVSIHRRRAGFTQRALATRAGISATYLNEIETGKKPGSVDALKKLAAALGISMEALTA